MNPDTSRKVILGIFVCVAVFYLVQIILTARSPEFKRDLERLREKRRQKKENNP
jgi:hypothetical protein